MQKTILRLSLFVICLLVTMLLSSCRTRFMKTSPFYTGKIIAGKTSSGQVVRWDDPKAVKVEKIFAHEIKAKMDDDRIYVWPVFYKNFLLYSFLWPLAEINDVGWEIRPLVSVDDYAKDYRILTGGWNSKDDSHYILPLYVKTKNALYSLPYSSIKDHGNYIDNYLMLAGYFSEDNSSYLFPLYYYDGNKSKVYTPICSFSDEDGYVFPIYFYKNYEYGKTEGFTNYILPPLGFYQYESKEGKPYSSNAWFFPLFTYSFSALSADNSSKNQDYQRSFFCFPWIYSYKNTGRPTAKNIFSPFYFSGFKKYKDVDEKWLNIVPFFFSGYNKSYTKDKDWLACYPFYAYFRDKKDISRNYFLLVGNQQKDIQGKPYASSYVLPFYYYDYKSCVSSRKNPKYQGQVFKYNERPKDYFLKEYSIQKNSFYFPSIFSTEYENNQYGSFNIFPFLFKGHDQRYNRDKKWLKTFPFYSYQRKKEDVFRNYLLLAGTADKKIKGKAYASSYILPFYYYSYDLRRNTIVEKNYYFPSIFRTKYEDDKLNKLTVFPFYFSGHDRRYSWDKEWNSVFPFYFYSREKKDISRNYLCLVGTEETTIEDKKYNSSYVFPFYYYKYEAEPFYHEKNRRETVRKTSYVFPNYYSEVNEEKKEEQYCFFPFLFHKKNSSYENTGTPFSVFQRRKSLVNDDLSMQVLWYLYYFDRDQYSTTEYIFPSYYSYENRRNNHIVTNFFPFTFHEKTDKLDSFGTFLWLYTNRHYLPEKKKESQLFWYLYYNKQIAGNNKAKVEPYESSRVLWKVYHRETKGDVTNMDLFPFLSFSANKKRTRFSFAYRLFSWEAGIKSTKVHFLFMPVWW